MGMTIEETITRYKTNAEYERTHGNLQGCLEFRQLVEWLEELRAYRNMYHMGMTIDDSERYLRLMLGGMKNAVKYWEDKDKEESDIEKTNVEAVETALDTMRKYQKIEEIVKQYKKFGNIDFSMQIISGVIEDGNE